MPKPLHTVALTQSFLADCRAEGVTANEIDAIVNALAGNPGDGKLIVGSGGARKVRVAKPGGGKSGGYRLITAYFGEELPVYAMLLYSKGEKDNLTKGEINQLAQVLGNIRKSNER